MPEVTPSFNSLPPLSLYIHIPWCVRKCPYCDFNSHEKTNTLPEAEYIDCLLGDLDQEIEYAQGRPLHSIFFGGGTPSLFSGQAIQKILTGVKKRIAFSPNLEITLEANPGTVEQNKFSDYRNAGINRLSIGIQSFQSDQLKKLGRIHNSQEAINAVLSAKMAGFDNINIDLMHGLPNQTLKQGLADLEQALELSPTHISWYQLTIEPNTTFYNTQPVLPSDDQLADIQFAGEVLLQKHQFIQYEVSAFCPPQKQSKHNNNYWLFGDYIGIGAGAHGKITFLDRQYIKRFWKTRTPKDYLDRNKKFCAGGRVLESKELPLEFMMNALRLREGFSLEDFIQNTGLPYSMIETTIKNLINQGLIVKHHNRVRASSRGRRFLNEILMVF